MQPSPQFRYPLPSLRGARPEGPQPEAISRKRDTRGRDRSTNNQDARSAYILTTFRYVCRHSKKLRIMQKIVPFLWFNDNAEEAVHFYTTVFKDGKINGLSRYGKEGPGMEGSVMVASFSINGQEFTALNGGPHFKFTEAVSFVINCTTQDEVDHYWDTLSAGGSTSQCGWLKDKFGLSWQVVPTILGELMQSKDAKKKGSAMKAMMKMTKLNVHELQQAYDAG